MARTSVGPAARLTLVVPTKNRKEELRRALLSVRRQTIRITVLVMDDASTDGTSDMVVAEFPEVVLHRSSVSGGPTAARNRGTQLAETEIVASIDDDCVFEHPDTLEKSLRFFENESVGLVSIPYIDVLHSAETQGNAPDSLTEYAASTFRGCAYAVRRDAFLSVGGYREVLRTFYEEDDLSIRLLDRGYLIVAADAPPVHHYESPRRDRLDMLGARNTILFTWFNVPLIALPIHLIATTINLLVWGVKAGRLRRRSWGVVQGFRDTIVFRQVRAPVKTSTYRLYRRLKKRGPQPIATLGKFVSKR